jgi:prepilin-type N-terminal cleavage/methylation domain-containing protein
MTNRVERAQVQAGFTLIELLVVVLIIGILASVAVPQYFQVVEKGRFSEAMSTFSTLKGAQERYLMGFNSYAGDVSALDIGQAALKHYVTPTTLTGAVATWRVALVRSSIGAPGGSTYQITFTGPAGTMACSGSAAALCTSLLP